MECNLTINHELDVPIYQQLVDTIRTAIKKGNLKSGQQLPTMQEMTQKLAVARGTVKRSYDELERAGLLENVLPIKKKLARMVLRPSPRCLSHIIKLRSGAKVGIMSYSPRFGQLLYEACTTYAEDVEVSRPVVISDGGNHASYLKGKDAILVPKHYNMYFGAEAADVFKKFKGELIECYYEMDEGSLIYLEAKIKRLTENKTL